MMRRSHVERRSLKYAPIQYVSDTHHVRPPAPIVERNAMTRPLSVLRKQHTDLAATRIK
jgi:hypothetical protein